MRRGVLLFFVLCCAALSNGHDVRIIQPKARFALSGPRGITVPFQARVERHSENRWVQLEVWDGEMRIQSSGWSIEGEDAAAIQPALRPLFVRLGPGRYAFRALACTSVTDANECGRVRASAVQEIRVCGGSADEC